jgi:hypothetical protein
MPLTIQKFKELLKDIILDHNLESDFAKCCIELANIFCNLPGNFEVHYIPKKYFLSVTVRGIDNSRYLVLSIRAGKIYGGRISINNRLFGREYLEGRPFQYFKENSFLPTVRLFLIKKITYEDFREHYRPRSYLTNSFIGHLISEKSIKFLERLNIVSMTPNRGEIYFEDPEEDCIIIINIRSSRIILERLGGDDYWKRVVKTIKQARSIVVSNFKD